MTVINAAAPAMSAMLVPLSAKSNWHKVWNKFDNAFPHFHTMLLIGGVAAAVVLLLFAAVKLAKSITDRGAFKYVLLGGVIMFLVSSPGTVGGWIAQIADGIGKGIAAIIHVFASG